jgi:general L-amino acid transport system substrate-binding protein
MADGLRRLAVAAGVMVLAAGGAVAQEPAQSPTVAAIKQRGELSCGVDTGIPGFAFQDNRGSWQGFDITYCRAIAAAVLGDP